MDELLKQYHQLGETAKSLLQVCAVRCNGTDYRRLWDLARELGIHEADGKQLTQKRVREYLAEFQKAELVLSQKNIPAHEIHDFLIREGLETERVQSLAKLVSQRPSWMRGYGPHDLYSSFYSQDEAKFRLVISHLPPGSFPLLSPFCEATFDRLTPQLQQCYFEYVVPGWVKQGGAEPSAVDCLKALIDSGEASDSFQPITVTWALATGDLAMLRDLSKVTGKPFKDVEGCLRLLEGDWQTAFGLLSASLSARQTKQSSTQLGGLPSVFASLSGLCRESGLSAEKALQAVGTARGREKSPYVSTFELIDAALKHQITPADPAAFAKTLSAIAEKPLDRLIAAYLHKWLIQDENPKSDIAGVAIAAAKLEASGCRWLAAEAYGLAGGYGLKNAPKHRDKAQALHRELGTSSLIHLVQPVPDWSRKLAALSRVGEEASSTDAGSVDAEAQDRLIYEWHQSRNDFSLVVYHQLRKGNKWSKGRKVGLSRLYHEWKGPKFRFLAPQDHALCNALQHHVEQGPYGYPEEHCYFESQLAVRALIGHPRVYLPGERDQPLEIAEAPVRLLVRQADEDAIEVFLEPQPQPYSKFHIQTLDTHQRVITQFEPAHLKLHAMLGKGLKVPASAADQVMRTVAGLTSLVTVHSEIGGVADQGRTGADGPGSDATSSPAQRVEGDTVPHLHLRPSGEGFRVQLRVHPLGQTGPACVPGAGGQTVLATIDGVATSADRNFDAELRRAAGVLEQTSVLSDYQVDDYTAVLPTPVEGLQMVEELDPLVEAGEVLVHWPKGKSLQLAGRATESMMRVSIRRDRDWFAATGKLKIDRNLTIDMLELMDLVEESPSRFVQLDDGRFVSLTESLRARVRDLRSFGDGRSVKNKLRFAAVHAGLLEDLGEIKVSADAHWKKCVARMKTADEVGLRIPATLQAELRDYQREGVHWMMRLAAWGVGGCLADDMGLGKTVQAIAMLLNRADEGPAIVVAPTSVIYNWQDELHRFAPTLMPHVLADADRGKLLESLAAGDVLLCSYGLLATESKAIANVDFATLILDEAQAIKNPATQRSRAAKRLSAGCRFILTGTPMENHLGELWNLMDFINPGLLGSEDSFQQRYAIPIERDGARDARHQLKRLVSPFILRRTKAEVLTELPSRTEVTLRIEPSDAEAAFYEAVRQRALEAIEENAEDKPTHLRVLGEIMRLRRACCHPKLVVPESDIPASKLSRLMELVDDLREGNHRALVFSQFVDHLGLVREECDARGIPYQYLDGSTPAATRKKRVKAFQAGEGEVFLISLKAGGTGLNLTAADYVIHLDPWWNPAVEDQASDRAHRIGQQRPVTIYRMILEGTIEERILELHATKRDLADSLLEGTDQSGKLSTEDLLRLIRS